ncbi:hypothetical protein B0H10DRAFT_1960651 [Mycena sp. CBHHK59/15]|nr:hypothetical protein B0H10DRAFT_1960651 [Mycena sp. CBHHK59/15]
MKGRPDNPDTADEKAAKENALSQAFMQYLSGTGDFADFDAEDWEHTYVWDALKDSKHLAELAKFAIVILNIVANQAGCERTFSRTKVEQKDHCNRLGLDKTEKRTKIHADIRAEHQKQGLVKPRQKRKNHKSTATLLRQSGATFPSSHNIFTALVFRGIVTGGWLGEGEAVEVAGGTERSAAKQWQIGKLLDGRMRLGRHFTERRKKKKRVVAIIMRNAWSK